MVEPMATATDKSVSASSKLPQELENLIDQSIDAMDSDELNAWKKDSEKIMADSRHRSDASAAPRGISR
jgi:hypothetical protein